MIDYALFLEKIIDDGIAAAKEDYEQRPEPGKTKTQEMLSGSVAGFEACRNKMPKQLVEIYNEASEYANAAFCEHSEKYWWFNCYKLEVEWVINVVSAGLGFELLSHLPTYRGVMKAANILGVQPA